MALPPTASSVGKRSSRSYSRDLRRQPTSACRMQPQMQDKPIINPISQKLACQKYQRRSANPPSSSLEYSSARANISIHERLFCQPTEAQVIARQEAKHQEKSSKRQKSKQNAKRELNKKKRKTLARYIVRPMD